MWPSVWQLWQLIQPSCDSLALENSRSPRSAAVGSGRGPRRDRRGPLAGRRGDDRDRVVERVGDVDELAVRADGHGRRPAAHDDPARPLVRRPRRSRPRRPPPARRSPCRGGRRRSRPGRPPRSRRPPGRTAGRRRAARRPSRPPAATRPAAPAGDCGSTGPSGRRRSVACARRLSTWCASTSVRPSGEKASPRMLCAGSDRTDSIARRWRSTTASRPPNASATTSREPSANTAISRGQNGRSRLPAIDSAGLASSGARGARPTNVSRRDQVEATTADEPPRRHDDADRVRRDRDPAATRGSTGR